MSNKRMVSVSLNQIQALTTTDGLVIHRQKVNQVCVVGNVLSVNEQTTKITYVLTDYTGPSMEVVLWKNSGGAGGDESRMMNFPVIMEQTYAKVYGQARKDANGNAYLVAFNIQPLANLNDLTTHLIETVHHSNDLKRSKMNHLCNAQSGGSNLTSGAQMSTGSNAGGFNDIQNTIMNLIKENTSDIGISLEEIYSSIRSVKADTVKSTIDFLLNEGHIYEALDEVHFKSSD